MEDNQTEAKLSSNHRCTFAKKMSASANQSHLKQIELFLFAIK